MCRSGKSATSANLGVVDPRIVLPWAPSPASSGGVPRPTEKALQSCGRAGSIIYRQPSPMHRKSPAPTSSTPTLSNASDASLQERFFLLKRDVVPNQHKAKGGGNSSGYCPFKFLGPIRYSIYSTSYLLVATGSQRCHQALSVSKASKHLNYTFGHSAISHCIPGPHSVFAQAS